MKDPGSLITLAKKTLQEMVDKSESERPSSFTLPLGIPVDESPRQENQVGIFELLKRADAAGLRAYIINLPGTREVHLQVVLPTRF